MANIQPGSDDISSAKPTSQVLTTAGDGCIQVAGGIDQDAWELARAGKKQVLERRFGLASMIGFSCSTMITWESTIFFVYFGLTNGGPAGLIWGFLICWIGTASVFLSMGRRTVLLVIHILGFFAFLIPLLVVKNAGSQSHHVFTTFYNGGGWSSQTLSVFVGFFGNAAAFLGTDGAIHMSEEITNSSINTPRSMIFSILINGMLGFVLLIVFLLTGGSLESILAIQSPFPYMQMLQNALGQSGAVTVLVSVLIAMSIFCGTALMSSSSRMVWSFARERALPGWKWLRQINRQTSIPTHSTYAIVLVAALLGLINLGSTATFDALTSLSLEGLYLSYLIAISLLLYRRVNGDIKEMHDGEKVALSVGSKSSAASNIELVWGPWRLKGTLGVLNNVFAILYLVTTMFFSFWPSMPRPTAATMNWSVVILGCVGIFCLLYYYIAAKKQYTFPSVEVEVLQM